MVSYRLHIKPPEGSSFVYDGPNSPVVLGRAPTSDLVVADQFLSRHHVRVAPHANGLVIEDLQSRNGTFVNGHRINGAATVKHGDMIQISETVIRVDTNLFDISDDGAPITNENMIIKPASDLVRTQEFKTSEAWRSDHVLRGYVERLELLNEIHEALGQSMSLSSLLQLILDRVFHLLQPQQAVIFLKDADGSYSKAAKRTQQGLPDDVPLSQSLITEVAEKGMAALVFDLATDKRFSASESIQTAGIRSLMASPLQDDLGSLGFIVLSSKVVKRQFTEQDMALLASLASVAALKIRNAALSEEAAIRRALEQELSLARTIQVMLIPDQLPDLKGYDIVAHNAPSRAVSGDYYEAVTRKNGEECVFMVADVSGKGVAASLLTASLEALSASPIEDGLSPYQICEKLSRLLIKRTSADRYATMFLMTLSRDSGVLTFANAGHNPALLIRADGRVEPLERTGLPIGLLPIHTYTEVQKQLELGDFVLIYTDGLTEARNVHGDEFEMEKLIDVCVQHRAEEAADIGDAIEAALQDFVGDTPFDDDRTYIIIKRDPVPPVP